MQIHIEYSSYQGKKLEVELNDSIGTGAYGIEGLSILIKHNVMSLTSTVA